MSAPDQPEGLEPKVRRKRGIAAVWLIPILAVGIGAWLVYTTLEGRGPTITITFPSANGMEAGKTKVKLRDVEVGTVTDLELTDDIKDVIATVEMASGSERYLTTGTRFWVVQPQIGIEGVTGLSTLLSGVYIAVEPSDGKQTRTFTGLEQKPPIPKDAPGKRFALRADRIGALRIGSQLFYRDIPVGEVTGFVVNDQPELSRGELYCNDAKPHARRAFTIEVYVRSPLDRLVLEDSRFVNASGISLDISGGSVRLELESLSALLNGAIGFSNPRRGTLDMDGDPAANLPTDLKEDFEDIPTDSKQAEACKVFVLYQTEEDAKTSSVASTSPFLIYFSDSIAGLEVGSPVTLRGIRVGQVTDIVLSVDLQKHAFQIPVEIEIFDNTIRAAGDLADSMSMEERQAWLVSKGLRAQLASSNFLTGAKEIRLDIFPDAAPAELDRSGPIPVIPSIPSSLDQLQASVQNILNKVAALPIDQIGDDLRELIESANALVSSPELHQSVRDVSAMAASLRHLAGQIDAATGPLVRDAKATMDSARNALGSVDRVVKSSEGIPFDVKKLLADLSAAAKAIRAFAEYLDRNPEALIQGRQGRR